jgi:hypothetical protein
MSRFAAVKVLLEGGADPQRKNKNGSAPMLLATFLSNGESSLTVDATKSA